MKRTSVLARNINCRAHFEENILITDIHDDSDVLTLIAHLKACGEQKDLLAGTGLHIESVRRGLFEKSVFVGNTLISMYAKCGALEKAQEVFYELSSHSIVSWNALIAGYVQNGHCEKAIDCFRCMQTSNCCPDACTFACVLKACGSVGDLHKGQSIHCQIVKEHWTHKFTMLGNALIDLYAKLGALQKAQQAFDELATRDIVSWTALIAGYAQHEYAVEAINCFNKMQAGGFTPNSVTFACILKACGCIGALLEGQEIHAQIARGPPLEKNTLVINALIDMYVKCGALEKAQEMFDNRAVHDVVTWTALIAGYTRNGYGELALNCYVNMLARGLLPNAVTFACVLRACGGIEALEQGIDIHHQVEREGLLEKDILVANALIDMYVKCGVLGEAQRVLDNLPFQNVVSWTTLITGYAEHGCCEKAWSCFERMQLSGLPPNEITFACILKACGNARHLSKGFEVHAQLVRARMLEHVMVANALVDMYAKCGALEKAQKVFDALSCRNVISWNGLIAGYVQHGLCEEALECFKTMQARSFSPNLVTLASVLKALGNIGALDRGQEVHAMILREYDVESDIVVANSLLDMYVKCGALDIAHDAFCKLLIRDLVSWNTLITGFAEYEHDEKALSCYERMQLEALSPDAVTFACILKACGGLGIAYKGKRIHAVAGCHVFVEQNNVVGIGLLVLYASCGMLAEAHDLFDRLPVRDVASWGALMEGYTQMGNHEIVLSLFEKMLTEGIEPDMVTFATVLNACSHGGILDKGQMYFEIIRKADASIMTADLHSCMVNLLGRAGLLDKASLVIEEMPFSADSRAWHTLLGACQNWVDLKFGGWAFKHAIQMDEMDAASYISMQNIFAAARRKEQGQNIGESG